MDLIAIKKLAYDLMGGRSSHSWKEKGNKYLHGERVAKLVLKLRKLILPGDDSHDDILTVAAWFHDISNGVDNHAEIGADRVRQVLNNYCTIAELKEICAIIRVHDDRYNGRDTYSDYIKLHQDADLLDHFGTYEIWINIAYVVTHGNTLDDLADWINDIKPVEKFRKELNFEISKTIYDEKSSYARNFGNRFKTECMGEIWNENELLSDLPDSV